MIFLQSKTKNNQPNILKTKELKNVEKPKTPDCINKCRLSTHVNTGGMYQ